MIRELLVRIGTFFILIGLGVFILFVASDSAGIRLNVAPARSGGQTSIRTAS
ncbi:MAG: hypothetical protein ACK2T0_12005 [Anaerolineales bacterium]